ncbi:aldehyde dehydrogenase family protein [Micromonospora sp. NPDC049102]|uniref:aldehyde dehydrogenase family protein n=1 Tax=Micromonospora sp. NPDC049102 TaxID=3364265 RepID=UPI0037249C26
MSIGGLGGTSIGHFVDGKRVGGTSERRGDVFDPATGRRTAEVELASTADVDVAVRAAARAARDWRDASLAKRSAVLFAFRELVHARRDRLAEVITAEHGKVLADAAGEVQRGLEVIEYACGLPSALRGAFSENVSTEVDSYTIRQPLGVVAVISPFNFPVMVPLWFVPVAVARGDAVVLKPSEKDPSAALLLAEWFAEAGLPDGVRNVVNGAAEAVDALLDHPEEAVELVNASPYGNGTAIFTNDGGAARRYQHEVEVGMVGINVPIPVPMAYHSFGGWKSSLFGDLHAHGEDGVRFFTRGKVVTSRWWGRGGRAGLPGR